FADRVAARVGAELVAGLGLTLFAGALAFGAMTTLTTGDFQAVAWLGVSGLGLGLVLPTTIDTALGAVDVENSGVTAGVLEALRSVGGALGAAILGAVLNSTYRGELGHMAPAAPASATDSAVGGVDTASAAHSPAFLHSVRDAFLTGMNTTLWI